MTISGEFHDETRWTITLQQPTAVQVEAASGAVVCDCPGAGPSMHIRKQHLYASPCPP
jgi:hypothetical protein